ncbi:MAG TPA: hypothetical protein VK027_03430 [Chitinophagaceae bacterium]|nr:hypothetical protein [Chitinophagaceae bacterium]
MKKVLITWKENKYLHLFFLIIVSFLAFYPILNNGYNLDDELVTIQHVFTSKGWEGITDIWKNPYYSDNMGYSYGYRPTVLTSFAIEHALFGESAQIGHAIQLLLYLLTGFVLFNLLSKSFPGISNLWITLATTLFLIHPIHTEVVASLKNRDEILALLLGTSSILLFFHLEKIPILLRSIFAGFLFLLALWAKKSALPLLFFIPILYSKFAQYNTIQKFLAIEFFALITIWGIIDLNPRLWLLLGLPFSIGNYIFHFYGLKIKEKLSEISIVYIIPLLLFLGLTIYFKDAFFWILALIACHFLTSKTKFAVYLFVLLALFGSFYFNWHTPLLFLPFYLFFLKDTLDLKSPYFLILLIVSMAFHPIFFKGWINILLFAPLIAYYFLARYKKIISSIFLALILGSVLITGFAPHSIPFITVAVLLIIDAFKNKITKFFPYILALGILFIFTPHLLLYFEALPSLSTLGDHNLEQGVKLLDGRSLEFVENPLVFNPHWIYSFGLGVQSCIKYLQLLFFPYPLSFYYGYDTIHLHSIFDGLILLKLLSILLFLYLGIQLAKYWKNQGEEAWFLWTTTALLLLFSSLFMFSNALVFVAGIIGERLIYIGSLGFILLIISMIAFFLKKLPSIKIPFLVLLASVCIVQISWDIKRSKMWKNAAILMQNDMKHLGQSAQANNLYALTLMNYSLHKEKNAENARLQQETAIKYFQKAVDIHYDFFNAAFDKGRAQMVIHDYQGALESFRYSLEINKTNYMEPYRHICSIYRKFGENKLADYWAREALKIDPSGVEWQQYLLNNNEEL